MATTTTLEIDSTVEDGTTVLSLEPVSGAPDDNPWTDEVDEADETDDDSDSDSDAELEAAMDKAMDEAIEAALRGEGEGEDEDSKEDPPVEASNVPAIFKVIEIGNDKESLDVCAYFIVSLVSFTQTIRLGRISIRCSTQDPARCCGGCHSGDHAWHVEA